MGERVVRGWGWGWFGDGGGGWLGDGGRLEDRGLGDGGGVRGWGGG